MTATETGRKLTYTAAFTEAVRLEMAADPDVFIAGEDVGAHGGVFHTFDGIQKEKNGRLLVSNHFGRLYRVDQAGKKTLLIDTFTPGEKIADFCFLPRNGMLVIPTFDGNSINAYTVKTE